MSGFTWNVDPVLLRLGPLQLRYYGICFALTIILGYLLLERHLVRLGYTRDLSARFLLYAVVGLTVGARLMHCFAYQPEYYLQNPIEIVRVWQGGLASHGGAIGLVVAGIVFSRVAKIPFFDLADAGVFAGGVGAALVRIGNFFNSEIVGRVTTVPWAVRFARRDAELRHPSQLYEAAGAIAILSVMLVLSRRERPYPRGFFFGFFFATYFTFRFFIEFVKEYHTLHSGLTMGQYLSIPFILIGIMFVLWSRRRASSGTESVSA